MLLLPPSWSTQDFSFFCLGLLFNGLLLTLKHPLFRHWYFCLGGRPAGRSDQPAFIIGLGDLQNGQYTFAISCSSSIGFCLYHYAHINIPFPICQALFAIFPNFLEFSLIFLEFSLET